MPIGMPWRMQQSLRASLLAVALTGTGVHAATLTPAFSLELSRMKSGTRPAVAHGGGVSLVVWTAAAADGGDIHATRIGADGSVLDADGIVVSAASGAQAKPVVTFDGTNFLVVWVDQRDPDPSDWKPDPVEARVFAARVTPDGTVLDPAGIAITPRSAAVFSDDLAVVASGGGQSLVVHTSGVDVGPLCLVRVSTDGAPSGAPHCLPAPNGFRGQHYAPGAAFDGRDFLLTWEAARGSGLDLRSWSEAARVAADGTLTAMAPVPWGQRALPRSGDGHVLVQSSLKQGASTEVLAATLLSGTGASCVTLGEPAAAAPAAVTGDFDGRGYVVAFRAGPSALHAVRVLPEGVEGYPGAPLLDFPSGETIDFVSLVSVGEGRSLFVYTAASSTGEGLTLRGAWLEGAFESSPDAGAPASCPDGTGTPTDAGTPADAGAPEDAGSPAGAGASGDAGLEQEVPPPPRGCTAGAGNVGALMAGAVLLRLLARRRAPSGAAPRPRG